MLLDDTDLPVAILAVLSEECGQRWARAIPTPEPGRLPEHSPRPDQAEVELVVLVANEFLVEEADPGKNALAPATEVNRVRGPFVTGVMAGRAPGGEGRLEGGRDRTRDVPVPTRHPGAADVVR